MAATHKGGDVYPKSPHSNRCGAELKDGRFCGKWAQRGEEHCFQHSVSEAEWKAMARRGGLKSAQIKREKKAASPRSGLVPHVNLEVLLRVCVEGLEADFADAGLPGEIDHATRLMSVAALLAAFPRYYRTTPEDAAVLLASVLPERLHELDEEEKEREFRRQAEASYAEMRLAWDRDRFASELRGLYEDESYPPWAIGAWEDKEKLNAERRKRLAELRAKVGDARVTSVYTPV